MGKLLICFLVAAFIGGCATKWNHPDADENRFRIDLADCQIYAKSSVPDNSTPYDPNLTAQQQSQQSYANAGAQLARSISLKNQFDNCMYSKGYSK
jgi:hypothetical protein